MVNIEKGPFGESEHDARDEAADARAEELFKAQYEDHPKNPEELRDNLDKQLSVLQEELKAQEERRDSTKSEKGKESVNATVSNLKSNIAKVEAAIEEFPSE